VWLLAWARDEESGHGVGGAKVGQLLFDHLPTAARRMTEQNAFCGAKEHAEVKDIQSLTPRDKKDDVSVDHM
jgi:hypothetical protein